jgi:hypothetical protein
VARETHCLTRQDTRPRTRALRRRKKLRQRKARRRRLHACGQQTFIELTEGAADNLAVAATLLSGSRKLPTLSPRNVAAGGSE